MTKAESRMTTLFDQGVQTFGEAFKASVKMQEEAAKWWSEALEQAAPMQDWQKKGRSLVSEVLPAAQKSAEEWMKLAEMNYRRSMDLIKKAFNAEEEAAFSAASSSAAAAEPQYRGQEVWDASMQMVRDSTQAMAVANMKMMEAWADVLRKAANGQGEMAGEKK